ncbi:MAG: DCC1-like thiol-disulfide oxidoreductase family protein [Acidimicrobiales bacterium]
MDRTGPPMFLFDGDCAFCSACARWMAAHIPGPTAIRAWQQTDLAPLGVTEAEADEAVVMVDVALERLHGPEAIAALLGSSTSRTWRLLGTLLALRPVLVLAWPTYRLVARHRDRMPGGTPQCALPAAERGGHLGGPSS